MVHENVKQMTTAEAREAGLLDGAKGRKPRTTRKTEPRNKAETRCVGLVEWTIQRSVDGPLVAPEHRSDLLDGQAVVSKALDFLPVDRGRWAAWAPVDAHAPQGAADGGVGHSELVRDFRGGHAVSVHRDNALVREATTAGVFLPVDVWWHDLQILWTIVSSIAVDVVDVIFWSGPRDQPMLTDAYALGWRVPDEFDVSIAVEVARWVSGRNGLIPTQRPGWTLSKHLQSHRSTGIAPSSVAARSRYGSAAFDADDFTHEVTVYLPCGFVTGSDAAETRHVESTHHARIETVL